MAPGSSALPRVILHVSDPLCTGYNRFGLFREYKYRPSYDPDSAVDEDDLAGRQAPQPPLVNEVAKPPAWPFANMSTYLLMDWMFTGSNCKSIGEIDRLAKDVLSSKDFHPEDLSGFSARREN